MRKILVVFALAVGLASCGKEQCFRCTATVSYGGQSSSSTSTTCVTGGAARAVKKVKSLYSSADGVTVRCN